MKIEREVKFLDIDVKESIKRLKSLGAQEIYDGVMQTSSYDIGTPGLPMSLLPFDAGGQLTLVDMKNMRFFSTIVDDIVELRAMFGIIGLNARDGVYSIPKRLRSIEERGMRFRLRSKGNGTQRYPPGEITLKTEAKYKKVKECAEYQVDVRAYGECREILRRSGMRELRTYDKRRTEYLLEDRISVVLDTIPEVPTYLEIEADEIADIKRTAKALGYRMKDASLLTTRELRAKYRAK